MNLTPRQIDAYLEFSRKLDSVEREYALAIAAVGAQGDDKAIEKMRTEINR